MTRRTGTGFALAALLLLAGILLERRNTAPEKPECWTRCFPVMGTVARFTFYTADEAAALRASQAAESEFARVSRMANLYDPASELSRLNAAAYQTDFPCSAEMWFLLMRAKRAWRESGGEFDITVKPLMDLWGFYRKRGDRPPSADEISEAKSKTGFDRLHLDEKRHTIRFTVPGMALDLGGIAKGYAADLAAQAAISAGITAGVIDLGGNLKLLPQPPPGKTHYTVAIRDPRQRGRTLPQMLALPGSSAVATSGDYERFVTLGGMRYGHIISPRTGKPAANAAVTVTTASALDADIFSTTAYLTGVSGAAELSALHPGTKFYFVPAPLPQNSRQKRGSESE